MPIPKPSETKQPILNYLTKAGKPVKVSVITELMGTYFKLSKKQMEEKSPKGTKRLAMSITASTQEMKAAGLVKSPRHGYLAITAKGRGGIQAGGITSGKKPGRPPKAKSTNGRRKPGRPSKAQVKAKNGRRKPGRPKMQVKATTNGRRKPGRPPKTQTATQLPATISKQDNDKLVQKAADIVISYAGNNTVKPNQIPEIIRSTYAALSGLGSSSASSTSGKTVGKRKYTRRKVAG